MGANITVANSMQTATKVMQKSNAQLNPQKMSRVMTEFQKQNQVKKNYFIQKSSNLLFSKIDDGDDRRDDG